jgi:hypothetical protein
MMQKVAADLGGLRQRLVSGIYPVMRNSRDAKSRSRDTKALAGPWPPSYHDALAGIRDEPWPDPAAPALAIADLTQQLRDQRPLLIAALLNPVQVLDHIEATAPVSRTKVANSWIGMYWLSKAAWGAIGAGLPAAAGFAVGEADLLLPLAARLWFLVGSEPMRSRTDEIAWWTDSDFGNCGALIRVLGEDSWHQFVSECRAARRAWLDCLNTYQSQDYLSQATPAELEQELSAVVFATARHGPPLAISQVELTEPAALDAADRAVIGEVTERHLLPRFDLRSVTALAIYDSEPGPRLGRRAFAVVAVAAGLAAAGCTAALLVHEAFWLSIACYLVIAVGVMAFGAEWAAPWLLRLPAAAAVGAIALISFLLGGWLTAPRYGWAAATALGGAALGYLIIEVRNHGVAGAALLRSLGVAAIGVVQALMVALIAMVAIAPAFAAHARALERLWDRPGYGDAGMVLTLAAAWCLAVGVFSQVLWDDRPITAPLAHVSWRSRR